MTKKQFLIDYILYRLSHKKKLDDLLTEAIKAWDFIEDNSKES